MADSNPDPAARRPTEAGGVPDDNLVTIVVDDRERRSGLADALSATWPRVAIGRLPVGDVEVGPNVLVERKTVHDLVASLADGRLYSQAYAICGASRRRLLVVEGRDATPLIDVPPRSLRGALLTLTVGYGLPLLRTDDVRETAELLTHLARQEQRRDARRRARRGASTRPPPGRVAMDLLGAVPGVGDLRARRLLRHFGSAGGALTADEADLRDVPGIGRRTADAGRRAADDAGPPGNA